MANCATHTGGYASKQYAESFTQHGAVQHLPASDSWVIQRHIEDSPYKDAIGCYPLFSCANWDMLEEDINSFAEDIIAFSLVTDPFSQFDAHQLQALFPDVCKPFKSHFILDLDLDLRKVVRSNHLRNAKKARKTLHITYVDEPATCLQNWITLYDHLIERHEIEGIARFSHYAFAKQFDTPGLHVYQASLGGEIVGMVLFYQMGETVYYHLGAYSPTGYAHRASFGIFWQAIVDFKSRHARWLNLGSGAGLSESEENGLVRFKKGWASDTRTAWFCGKILNQPIYTQLTSQAAQHQSTFFPAYRSRL